MANRSLLTSSASLSRRALLHGIGTSALGATGVFMPAVSRAADRPQLPQGVQSGDVDVSSAVMWARADRPSRLFFELAKTDRFNEIVRAVWVDALPESDFTAKLCVDGL